MPNTLSKLSTLIGNGIRRNESRAERENPNRMFSEEAHHWELAFTLLTQLIRESDERNRQGDNE